MLTPTQRAICAVILENGGWNWSKFDANEVILKLSPDPEKVFYSMDFGRGKLSSIEVCGHTVTEQEYRKYERQEM